jgi:hypothetical protein
VRTVAWKNGVALEDRSFARSIVMALWSAWKDICYRSCARSSDASQKLWIYPSFWDWHPQGFALAPTSERRSWPSILVHDPFLWKVNLKPAFIPTRTALEWSWYCTPRHTSGVTSSSHQYFSSVNSQLWNMVITWYFETPGDLFTVSRERSFAKSWYERENLEGSAG